MNWPCSFPKFKFLYWALWAWLSLKSISETKLLCFYFAWDFLRWLTRSSKKTKSSKRAWHELWAAGLEFVTCRHVVLQDLPRQFHRQLWHFELDRVLSIMPGFFSWMEWLGLPQIHVWEEVHMHYHQSAEHSLETKPRACQSEVSPELLLCKGQVGLF